MNKLIKILLNCVISISILLSTAAIPRLASAENTLPEDGLLFHLTFDEENALSDSFDATIGGTVKKNGSVSIVPGIDEENGNALSIADNAAGNYLELPKGILNGKNSATFSFWLKTSSPATAWTFMTTPVTGAQTGGSEKYLGLFATASSLKSERYNVDGIRTGFVEIGGGDYTDWKYITAVYTPDSTRVYINGVLAGTNNDPVNTEEIMTAGASTWIGHANWSAGEGFSGMIDDFRIYGRALSETEITALSAKAVDRENQMLAKEKNCLEINTQFYSNDEIAYDASGKDINISIPSNNEKSVAVIGASYTDSILSNVKSERKDLSVGINSITLNGVKKNDNDTVKAFVWDSFEGIRPVPDLKDSKVFQISSGSSVTIKTTVTNYLPSERTVAFSVLGIDEKGSSVHMPVLSDDEKSINVMENSEFSAKVIAAPEIAYYKIVIQDLTDIQNPIVYDAGHLPVSRVSFPDASPEDTFGTTMAAHDPSIFKDPKTGIYYAYNTDAYTDNYVDKNGNTLKDTYPMDTFMSADLVNWERIDNNFRIPESAINFGEEIYKPIGSNMNAGIWAPDIFYAEEDTEHPYWLYYSLSTNGPKGSDGDKFAYIRSLIGLVKGKTPTGPWTDCGVVISSQEGYNTNAIDSNIYTDINGDRFFVWGSFQKGIHQVKLTENGMAEGVDYTSNSLIHSTSKTVGARLFSTPNGIMGPEGAYMVNNTDKNYRYMFTSYGWLGTNYNIRIARNPLDKTWAAETASSSHHKLLDHRNRKVGTTFTEQTDKSELWGYKMLGSYKLGDGLTYYGNGHNSVLHDDDGCWYLIEHCRKQPEGFAALQVRKMLWTDEGWPVVSPLVYAGEKEQAIPRNMLYGTWDLSSVGQTIHEENANDVGVFANKEKFDLPICSSQIILQADGRLGNNIGTWEYDNDHTVTINFTADGNNDKYEFYKNGDTMKLFVLTGYDKDMRESAIIMTGTDQNNIANFAKKNNAAAQSTKIAE